VRWGSVDNEEFIRCFETNRLPGGFHHADHVRLAFAYLSENGPLEALEKLSAALNRFAEERGKPDLYHATITHAYVFLIRERMARTGAVEWDDFARQNADLLRWKPGILARYYHEATLQSDLARAIFVFPDKTC